MFQAFLSGDQDGSGWVRLALPYIIRFVGPLISNFQKLLLALVIPFNLICIDIARGTYCKMVEPSNYVCTTKEPETPNLPIHTEGKGRT